MAYEQHYNYNFNAFVLLETTELYEKKTHDCQTLKL